MHKLFTIGPVEMYPSTKNILEKGFVHFRSPEYSEIVTNCLDKLSQLLGNKNKNSLIYLAASGTAAMEATIENCVKAKDKVLVINGGTFGNRFCELLKYHHKNFDSIDLVWNETLTEKHLEKYNGKNYSMLFVNIHETHTGQLYNIEMLSNFCKQNNLMLVVDAISSLLADRYEMDKYQIDLRIISSEKELCLSPGMSFVSFSPRMLKKVYSNNEVASKYFDFKDYLINITRGQTPYTPPVCIMYELQDMLQIIASEGGINGRLKIVEEKCNYFRKKAINYGLKMPTYPLSNMLTPILVEDIDAYKVIQVMKNKYKLFVNPCGGDLSSKLLRVSHIGNTTLSDIDNLIEKLILSIEEIKHEDSNLW